MAVAPETRYERAITLDHPADAVWGMSASLTGNIEELVKFLFPRAKGYELAPRTQNETEVGLSVSLVDWKIDLTCVAGNNMRYTDGQQVRYFSYTVRAQSHIPAVVKAEKLGSGLGAVLTVVFAFGFCGLLLMGCWALMDILGLNSMRIPVILIIGAVVLGATIGTAIGRWVGAAVAALAQARAYRRPGVKGALADWQKLTEGLDRILDSAEARTADAEE